MKITAMLAWFNEDPDMLYRAVASLDGFADRVVALDGGWDLYPGAAPYSPADQADAIHEAAETIGIQASIWPGQRWTGQVQKRHRLLFLAINARPDWVMPLDADWELTGDKAAARAELEHVDEDAVRLEMFTPINPDVDLDDVAATDWHRELAGVSVYEPFLMRALADMRVENHHWVYTGLNRHGHRVATWGNPGHYPQARTGDLRAQMRIVHHCFFRDQRTIQANRAYCEQRTEYVRVHGVEP